MGFRLVYCRADSSIDQGFGLWAQGFKIPLLHCVFAGMMDDKGALLRLLPGVTADIHKGIDHPIEGVYFVIPDDNTMRIFREQFNLYFLLLLPLGPC